MLILYAAIHLVLPVAVIFWFIKRASKSRLEVTVHFLGTGFVIWFLFLWGQYPFLGSHYLRYILLASFLWVSFMAFRNNWSKLPATSKPVDWRGYRFYTILAVMITLFGLASISATRGQFIGNQETVELALPMKGGTYYISVGGSSSLINLHMNSSSQSQHFAIDINKVNWLGSVASGLFPGEVERFYIFADSVYTPQLELSWILTMT